MMEIEKLHLKYKSLVDYADERQNHHNCEALKAEEKYRETGDIEHYQAAQNHKNVSLNLSTEVRAYRTFKDELKEVLDHAAVQ